MSQKIFYDLNNPADVEYLQRFVFDESEQEEDFHDDPDTDAEDEAAEERDGNSDTEESGADEATGFEEANVDNLCVEEGEPEVADSSEQLVFIGKDKITKWKKMLTKGRRRTEPQNIVTRLPGPIREARQAKTPFECWNHFFTDEMLQSIVDYTNQYNRLEVMHHYRRERDASDTDLTELKALIGLLYIAGTLRSNRLNLEDLWDSDGHGVEIFRLTMSLRRFRHLIRCLRFDDRTTRNERKPLDKIHQIRDLFEIFVENCKRSYSLGPCVTVDEKLEAFRGRCSFKQYIPSKPAKYGVKIYAMCDAKTFYTHNMEIYAGMQPEGPYLQSNRPKDVVKRLAQPIYGTGRNITADNWFSDVSLVTELKQNKISFVGTLKKNKRELPPEFLNVKERKAHSSMFGFGENSTIVSYIPKKRKNVIIICSQHFDDAIDVETGDAYKPQMITFYNATKSGVDVVDKLCATYNVARNTRRWPMVVFYSMLNVAGINAQVIFIGNGQENMRRRYFLRKLGHELALPHLQRRSVQSQGLPRLLIEGLRRFRPPNEEAKPPAGQDAPPAGKRRRCNICYSASKTTRLTKTFCKNCRRSICGEHTISVCTVCNPCFEQEEEDESNS